MIGSLILMIFPLLFLLISVSDLNVCPNGYTCCTSNMEYTLTQTSSAEFENIVYEKSSLLRDYFIRRTERFDSKYLTFHFFS